MKVNVNVMFVFNEMLLKEVCIWGYVELVEILIELCVDVNLNLFLCVVVFNGYLLIV